MKITEKQYEQIKNYIFDCIDFEDYDFEKTNDKKELLSNLIETFKNEYWHEYNKQYYKYNTINGFVSWLQGYLHLLMWILKITKYWKLPKTGILI